MNSNSEVAVANSEGSTGHQPVLSGYQPLGMTKACELIRNVDVKGGRLAVPSGQWPDGTGRWPVLPIPASAFGRKLGSFLVVCIIALGLSASTFSQNVVEGGGSGATLPPLQLTEQQVTNFLTRVPDLTSKAKGADAAHIAGKLDRHVAQFLDGQPWQAFHHTLGISGYESYFAHPDEEFLALTLALPHLKPPTAARMRTFLKVQLAEFPPYATNGFDRTAGRAREHYDVPDVLRVKGRGVARSALGVYAFWLYCHVAPDAEAAKSHWPKVRERMQALLTGDYKFDPAKRDYANDEAEKLNGDLAGLLGLWRLARLNDDAATEAAARQRAAQLLELRVNLERVNPKFVEKTRTANRSLHVSKLARYCSLVPEVAEAVRLHSGGLAATRLKAFREERNAWWLAFGDRFIGGENYTNPPHFVRALFTGAALLEQLPPERLASFVDVPWCRGDFYFIEQCALALGTHEADTPIRR